VVKGLKPLVPSQAGNWASNLALRTNATEHGKLNPVRVFDNSLNNSNESLWGANNIIFFNHGGFTFFS